MQTASRTENDYFRKFLYLKIRGQLPVFEICCKATEKILLGNFN